MGFIARSAEGEVVGVCSSNIEKGIYNGLLFHAMRVLVANEHRQNFLAFDLLAHLTELHFEEFKADPQSGPVGVKVVIQTPIVAERGAIRCARTIQFPVNNAPWTFLLSGFAPGNQPEYCCYFPRDDEASLAAQNRWTSDSAPRVEHVTVKLLHEGGPIAEREQVLGLLQTLSPRSAVAGAQAELAGRAIYTLYLADQLIALCELVPRDLPEINGLLVGLYTHTLTDLGKLDVAACFARGIYEQLEANTGTIPFGAVGLFMVYASRTALPPVCPVTGFHLHGVDGQGKELRVRFFDEIKVEVPRS
ncbi:hypothetical protein EY643_01555 [Halioglobus maricola]|uniref:Uncharacterized protein n=1 Tax=Halioglobus maricola TaxID=2601894 RepID=A0A5P9NF87_9GAMM|nr:hypothetical protein [Halioglobus maricola]QFU74443.1 hypothetical protein EY643_01555 [Halioglobus maricola]